MPWLQAILGGGFFVAVTNGIFLLLNQRIIARTKELESKLKANEEKLRISESNVAVGKTEREDIRTAVRIIIQGRIKWLAKIYLKAGTISYDDREDLMNMHGVYQGLGGNGNVTLLMNSVMELPLKDTT